MFQTTVFDDIAGGVVGELAFEGPLNGTPAVLNSGAPANNVIGRAFCYISGSTAPVGLHAKTVQAGGAGLVFCGILANPKTYANHGTAVGGSLAPSMTLRNGEIGEFVEHTPGIFVDFGTAAANVGDQVQYADATGILVPLAPGAAPTAAHTLIQGAVVVREPNAAGGTGLAIIALNGPLPRSA